MLIHFKIWYLNIIIGSLLFGWSCNSPETKLTTPSYSELKNDSATYQITYSDTLISDSVVIPSVEKNKEETPFEFKNGTLFYGQKPYSGHVIKTFPSGAIELNEAYFLGKKSGYSYSYYESGRPQYKRLYINGEKQGMHIGWFEDGQVRYKYLFVNGFSEGNHISWYENGMVYRDQNYQNGQEFGRQKVYRRDGKLRSNYIIRENGRKYGLVGLKRCDAVDTDSNRIKW